MPCARSSVFISRPWFSSAAAGLALAGALAVPAYAGLADQVGATFGLMLDEVEPTFSEAAFVPIEGKPQPRPEDGVRITRGRVRVAVVPPTDLTKGAADLRRVPFMLSLAMDQTKRFQSVDPGQVNEVLLNSKTRGEELLVRPDRAVSLGKSLDVMAWLIPVILERRGVTYLDVTWISAVTGAPLFSRRQSLARAEGGGDQRFPWEPRPED